MEILNNRIDKMKQNQKYNHLIIFAEGGTTAGDYITKFKRGIFQVNYPIKIEAFKYKGTIENTMCMVKTVDSFLGLTFNLYN